MSYQVANLNIGSLTVGQSSKISFGSIIPPSTIDQQMRPSGNTAASLFLFNESGSGLKCSFPISGETFTVAAGQWRIVSIPPNETQLTFTILYVLANAPVTQLLADLYIPGETMDAIGVLGNSPIGLSAVTLPVTQVIQDGQPSGQTILEATPSGLGQKLLMTTDGNFILGKVLFTSTIVGAGNMGTIDWESNLIVYRTVEVGATAQSHVFQVWDGAAAQNAFEVGREANPTSGTNIASTGAISRVAAVTTAGKYGVPLTVADAKDTSITNTVATTIASFTTPNDALNHRLRLGMTFWVGAGNTNNGLSSLFIQYTDPIQGVTQFSFIDAASLTLFSGAARTKGQVYLGLPLEAEASPNTSVLLVYQNTAAGTIADKVSAHIELLA